MKKNTRSNKESFLNRQPKHAGEYFLQMLVLIATGALGFILFWGGIVFGLMMLIGAFSANSNDMGVLIGVGLGLIALAIFSNLAVGRILTGKWQFELPTFP